jgi:hypothetical protein
VDLARLNEEGSEDFSHFQASLRLSSCPVAASTFLSTRSIFRIIGVIFPLLDVAWSSANIDVLGLLDLEFGKAMVSVCDQDCSSSLCIILNR